MNKSEVDTGLSILNEFSNFNVKYTETDDTEYANSNFAKQQGLIHRYNVDFKGDKGCFSICIFCNEGERVIGGNTVLSLNSFDRSIYISNDPSLVQLANKVLDSYPPNIEETENSVVEEIKTKKK